MSKLTFKQYLDGKSQLLEAVKNDPISSSTYKISRYCKLVIGESKSSKDSLALKPKQKLIIEWHYKTIENPIPISIMVEDAKTGDDKKYKPLWNGEKLLKWLRRNTIEQTIFDGDE